MLPLAIAAALFLVAPVVRASEPEGGRNERGGLVLGLGGGLGRPVSPDLDGGGYEQGGLVGGILDLRIGGGFTEDVALFVESLTVVGVNRAPGAADRLLTEHALLTVQLFVEPVDPHLYARGGAGVAIVRHRRDAGAAGSRTTIGGAIGGVLGYEWRFGRVLGLTLELGTLFEVTGEFLSATPLAMLGAQAYF